MLAYKSLAVVDRNAVAFGAGLGRMVGYLTDFFLSKESVRLERAKALAAALLPERMKHLAYEPHFEENYMAFMRHLPEGYRNILLWSILKGHADPLALGKTDQLNRAYELLPGRAVLAFALAKQRHTPGEMFGALSMRDQDPNYFDTPDLRGYPNFSELPDLNIERLLPRAPDLVVIGSGPGGGAAVWRYLRRRPNDLVLLLEGGPYISAQEIRTRSPELAVQTLFRAGGLLSALDVTRHGSRAITVMGHDGIGGSGLIYNGDLDLPADEATVNEIWPGGVPEQDHYWQEQRKFFNIRPIDESLMGALPQLLLQTGRRLFSNKPDWFTASEMRPIETAFLRACHGMGRCIAGCPGDTKIHSGSTFLPWALAAHPSNFFAVANHQVRNIEGLIGHARAVNVRSIDPFTRRPVVDIRIPLADKGRVIVAAGALGSPQVLHRSGLRRRGLQGPLYKGLHLHPITEILFRFDREIFLAVMATHPLAQVITTENGRIQSVMIKVPFYNEDGSVTYGYLENALSPRAIMAFASPGVIGEGLGMLVDKYHEIGMLGILLAESKASTGFVAVHDDRAPVFQYSLAKQDRRNMLKMMEIGTLLLMEAGVTDIRYNMVGKRLPSNQSDWADMDFFPAARWIEVMTSIRRGTNEVLLFSSHPGQTTLNVIDDPRTGRVKGSDNVFVMDNSSIPDTKTHPTATIIMQSNAKVDRMLE